MRGTHMSYARLFIGRRLNYFSLNSQQLIFSGGYVLSVVQLRARVKHALTIKYEQVSFGFRRPTYNYHGLPVSLSLSSLIGAWCHIRFP
jgi:hypothetical protein